jgi:hypothetical protein
MDDDGRSSGREIARAQSDPLDGSGKLDYSLDRRVHRFFESLYRRLK